MERTRVLHIITEMERGGAQLFTLFTVENLDHDRFDPYLLSNPRGILNGDAQKTLRERFLTVTSLVRPLSPLDDLKALFQIRNMVRRLNPEIVHTHSSKAGILGRWAAKLSAREVKLVHTVHGFAFSPFHGRFSNTVYKTLERLTAPITDLFLFVTDEDRKEAERLGLLKRSSWAIVRSIVGVERFRQAASRRKELREKMGIPLSTPVIGGLFPFKPQKDPLGFIEIANLVHQRLPQALFLVGGDGVLRREMERLIEELGLREWVRLWVGRRGRKSSFPSATPFSSPLSGRGFPRFLFRPWRVTPFPSPQASTERRNSFVKEGTAFSSLPGTTGRGPARFSNPSRTRPSERSFPRRRRRLWRASIPLRWSLSRRDSTKSFWKGVDNHLPLLYRKRWLRRVSPSLKGGIPFPNT